MRSARARQIRIRIDPAGNLQIVAPEGARIGPAPDLLRPYARWILRHMDRAVDRAARAVTIEEGATVPFRGMPVGVCFVPARHETTEPRDGRIAVGLGAGERQEDALYRWYFERAHEVISSSARAWSEALGVRASRLTIRDQRTRWGSCSSKGTLSFSWRLIMAPPEVLEYVVLHEVAHLIEHNHGPAFWALVESHDASYRARKSWLRERQDGLMDVLPR